MVVLEMRGNRFLGCSRYPECRSTRSFSTGVACPTPDCKGSLIERRTKRNKTFFGCSSYPGCTFATWDKPIPQKCDACNYPLLIEKDTKRKGIYRMCPQCKAEYPVPVVGVQDPAVV